MSDAFLPTFMLDSKLKSARRYFYRLFSGPEPLSTFEKDRAWHIPEELDVLAMQKACSVLVGCHDFSSFRATGCQANSPIRTLDELHVSEVVPSLYFPSTGERGPTNAFEQAVVKPSDASQIKPDMNGSDTTSDIVARSSTGSSQAFGQRRSHRCYVITARARSFLYHQVRLLVGVLKCVGTGELAASDVERILNAKAVNHAYPMAPAYGLYLGGVKYDLP